MNYQFDEVFTRPNFLSEPRHKARDPKSEVYSDKYALVRVHFKRCY